MKIAIVHDYLKEMGGAERVLAALCKMYPTAPIYTAFVDRNCAVASTLSDRVIVESKWGWILKIGKMYSYLRCFLPWIWQSIDLSEYDLVITSCSGYIARGFVVGKHTKVIAYCHTPPRWLYGYETPTGATGIWWGKIYLWLVGPFVRNFDYISAQRVDKWIANSHEVASRIGKFYRKEAEVIYPPCSVNYGERIMNNGMGSKYYWLVVSRIVGGKGIKEAIDAVKLTGDRLKIVGTGQQMKALKSYTATTPQVEWLGWIGDEQIAQVYEGAKGFLALARDEDFGMSVVESMAYGVPVLAYNGGGYKETIKNGVNGMLVDSYQISDISDIMKNWNKTKWDTAKIIDSVKEFGHVRFEKEIRELVEM